MRKHSGLESQYPPSRSAPAQKMHLLGCDMSSKEVSYSEERREHSFNTMRVCAAPYPLAAMSSQCSRTNMAHTEPDH